MCKICFWFQLTDSNLRATIKKAVPFSRVQSIIPTRTLDQLKQSIDDSDGFYCWAMTQGRKNLYNKMNDSDIVILKPNGQNQNEGYFKYKGSVVFKAICPELGNALWPSGTGWELIYFFKKIKEVTIKHSVLAERLHYEQCVSPTLQGTMRVASERIHRFLPDRNIDHFLDSIDEKNDRSLHLTEREIQRPRTPNNQEKKIVRSNAIKKKSSFPNLPNSLYGWIRSGYDFFFKGSFYECCFKLWLLLLGLFWLTGWFHIIFDFLGLL